MTFFSVTALPTNAQSSYGVRANVPFEFTVGDKTLQAGKILAGLPGNDVGTMTIHNLDNDQYALRMARTMRGPDTSDQAKLVFRKYGNRYFLAEVWIPGYNVWEVLKSKGERAIERELRLARNAGPEVVTVFAEGR